MQTLKVHDLQGDWPCFLGAGRMELCTVDYRRRSKTNGCTDSIIIWITTLEELGLAG